MTGNVIVLNGTSSAGKTTLAKSIQALAPEPYHLIAFDQFRDGLADRYRGINSPVDTPGAAGLNVVAAPHEGAMRAYIKLGSQGIAMVRGMHQAIVSFAQTGQHVVVDHFINHRDTAHDLCETLADLHPTLVRVTCDPSELLRRERLRPGRFPGTAETQRDIMSSCLDYDLTVDSTSHSAHELAHQVLSFLMQRKPTIESNE